MVSSIRKDLEWFAKKGTMSAEAGEKYYLTLLRNFSFAQLGAKPQIGLKQLASWTAYTQDVSTVDFISGMFKFAANPKAALRFLNKSDFFRNRGINIDQDFADMTSDKFQSRFINFMGRNPRFTRVMMIPIRFGDKGAIAIGGFAHIQAKMKAGKTEAEAMRSFERISTRTQQSSDPDQVSSLQRSSAFVRVMAQFMSSANALARAEYSAIVEVSSGRISGQEFAKRILVLHLIIPNTIQLVANGFNWDGEDQLSASLLGAINGIFILGDLVEFAINSAMGLKTFPVATRHPIDFAIDFIAAIADFQKNDISWEDFVEGNRAIDKALRGGSELTGIPFVTLYNMIRGLAIVGTGKVVKGGALMLGFSPYTIKKNALGK